MRTAQTQDLDYFRNDFDLDRAYSPAARARARQILEADIKRAGRMSAAQFDLEIARMVALADNGHSAVYRGPLSRRHDRLPCRLYRFSDGFHVVRARPACADLLGARIDSVDGRPIEDISARMYEFAGGPQNHYEQFISVFFLESPELLNAAGVVAVADRETLGVTMPDGSRRERTIVADPPDPKAPHAYSDSYLSPQKLTGEASDWKPLLSRDAGLPLFLKDYSTPFQTAYWPDKAVYYVQFKSNADEDNNPIGAFVSRVKSEITADNPRFVVLDQRLNQGGNFTLTAGLMDQIASLSPAIRHVYVLTSAWTFSAGIVSVALAKQHGEGKISIIGEPVGDRMRLWAEGSDMILPNSKLDIGYAAGLHDYSHPCWGESGCFVTFLLFPVHVNSLSPDVPVTYSYADYVALRDPMLDKALALAAAH